MKNIMKYCGLILMILILSVLSITAVNAEMKKLPVSSVVDEKALVSSSDKVPMIVGFKDKVGKDELDLLRGRGANIKRVLKEIKAVSVMIPPQAVDPLRKNPKIKYITVNNKGIHNTTESLPWGVDKIDAESVHPQYKGAGVLVAIPDTGIDYNHEDLIGKVIGGWDYVNNDQDPMDDFGHGTHVAGTIAAKDNDIGVIGVAPEASLLAMKMLDAGGSGYWDDAAASVIDSTNSGAKIISMSWGGGADDPTLKAAIQYAYSQGVLLIAGAGNGYGGSIIWPAAYPEVMAVTATDQNDAIAAFSSLGPKAEISAPGVDIPSTVPTGDCPLCDPSGYRLLSGTSMATPHVSGTAALIWSAYPGLTRNQVRSRITDYAVDYYPPGRDPSYGFGRIDAFKSVMQSPPSPPPTPYYMMIRPDYGWIDGITGGTQIQFDSPDDGTSGAIPLGMNFNFYGIMRTQLWVGTNGLISFDGDGSQRYYVNTPIPNTNPPNNFMAVYWDDLYMDSPASAYYKLDTSSRPAKLIITWQNVRLFSGSARTTFEAVLYEDGRILYQYQQPSLFEYDAETIGVEDVGGTRGQQYKYNEPVDDNSAVLFIPMRQSADCQDPARCVDVIISPNTQTILRDNPFQVNIVVDPKNLFRVAGVQVDYRFNGIVSTSGVTEGNFLNRGGPTFFRPGTINNPNGIIDDMGVAALYEGGQITTGTLATVSMTANNAGTSPLTVEGVLISDTNGQILPARIIPGEVVINICNAIWDVNHDGITDIRDIVIVGQHFGERPSPPYPAYDINQDGIIDIRDIVIIGQHFGQTTCWV